MPGSLPADPVAHATFRRPRRRPRLSRRRVKALLAIDQRWVSPDGRQWEVRQIWRKDGLVLLRRAGGREQRPVTFSELGEHYDLASRQA